MKGLGKLLLLAMLVLSLGLLFGCEGDDGDDGRNGTDGTNGKSAYELAVDNGFVGTEEEWLASLEGQDAAALAVESCAVCHASGKELDPNNEDEVYFGHNVAGKPTVSNVVVTPSGADLVVTFNLQMDGVPATNFNGINVDYRLDGATGERRDLSTDGTTATLSGGANGDYTITIAGGVAAYPGNSRYLFRVTNPNNALSPRPPGARALVVADYPATPVDKLVSDVACDNCHSNLGSGFHYAYPLDGNICVVCHDASNTTADIPRLPYLIHGIHASEQVMPSGEFVLSPGEVFKVTYPSYMNNCVVCHDTAAGEDVAVNTVLSYDFCMTCHENWEGFGDSTFSGVNHSGFTSASVCTACHGPSGANISSKLEVADFHNGSLTDRSGLIWNARDLSVDEGKKVDVKIAGVSYNADKTQMSVTWTADYNGTTVNPCNAVATVGAPAFHAAAANTATGQVAAGWSLLRAYGEGDDWTNNNIGTKPGQPVSTNLTTTNTVCASNVATTTVDLTAAEQATTLTRGIVALQGKAQVNLGFDYDPDTAGSQTVDQVRSKTANREFAVKTGAAVTPRRLVVDTSKCLKCHVGSLYQHGGNRIDDVDMCVMCHNEASIEQDVRVADGVDASEAYDGQVGQTYGFKSLLHAIHSSNNDPEVADKITMIYRTNGIYVWTSEATVIPNWPGTGTQTVPGSNPSGTNPNGTSRTHNLYHPTYPRPINDCEACHFPGGYYIGDQSKSVATTVDAGSTTWGNGNDDTLMGTNAAACISCHQQGIGDQTSDPEVIKAHLYQNGWVPAVFPNGRQTIIDAVK